MPMPEDRFEAGMWLLGAVFDPDGTPAETVAARTAAYRRALRELDDEAVYAACLWAGRTLLAFPLPGDLLAHRSLVDLAERRAKRKGAG